MSATLTSSQKILMSSLEYFDVVTRDCDAVSTSCMPSLDHLRIKLKYSEKYDSLPPKVTVRAGLETLGLVDEKNPHFTSTKLVILYPLRIKYFSSIWRVLMLHVVKCLGGMQGSHDQLNINQQVIAYSLIRGLNVDIGNILFSNLVAKLTNDKKGKELNVCYTRFLSLIIENLLGEAYKNDKLATFKPYHISAAPFKTPSTSEVALTSHMLKVAKISIETELTLIISSRKVNAYDTADKSLSETIVHFVVQPKAPTGKKSKKKKIPSSSKSKTSHYVRRSKTKETVTDTQHAKDSMATADTIKSLDASELAEELRNQPEIVDATKVHETIVEEAVKDSFVIDSGIKSLRNVNLDELIKDQKVDDAEITFVGSSPFDQEMVEADFDLESMPYDEIMSIYGGDNEEADSDQELSTADAKVVDHILDELINEANKEDTNVSSTPTNDVSFEFVPQSASTSSPADIQALIVKVVWKKKNILRVKIPNMQTLGAMRRYKEIQITKAPRLRKSIRKTVGKSVKKNVKSQINEINGLLRKCAKHQMQLISYIEQILYSSVKVPKDILWVVTIVDKLGIPPPPQLTASDLPSAEKKRKRGVEEIIGSAGLVIREPESGIFVYNGNFDMVFQRENEFHLVTTAQLIRIQNAIKMEYAKGLKRVKGDNTLIILVPFEDKQAELYLSLIKRDELTKLHSDNFGNVFYKFKCLCAQGCRELSVGCRNIGIRMMEKIVVKAWLNRQSLPDECYSPGPSTHPSYSSGPSASTPNLGMGECLNCKFLAEKIKTLDAKIHILEAILEMERYPENHTLELSAILHELYNDMENLGLE
ncbi:hypothetical protein Tco_1359463 [Tanacetum coccineum]